MAGAVKDAGEAVPCPSCNTTVLRKQMIPVLADDSGTAYLCVACARARRPASIVESSPLGTEATPPA